VDNIKMAVEYIGLKGVEWVHLSLHRNQVLDHIKTAIDFRVPERPN
jgi:hypothetical protein